MVSVGLFAHNEERSMEASLDSVCASTTHRTGIAEVLVVSTASTDRTDELAAVVAARYPNVRLIIEKTKRGKAYSVNRFLEEARCRYCVLANADTILHPDAIENLCSPLLDETIGMVGGHPVPVAPKGGLLGAASDLFWELHHRLCLRSPKMGELVAFRRSFDRLPVETAGADEDWIHAETQRQGLTAAYAPDAILYNRNPSNLAEFVAHRRRLALQHRTLSRSEGFSPPSRDLGLVARITLEYLRENPLRVPAVVCAAALEFAGRASAALIHDGDGRSYTDWQPLHSARGITVEEVERVSGRTTRPRPRSSTSAT